MPTRPPLARDLHDLGLGCPRTEAWCETAYAAALRKHERQMTMRDLEADIVREQPVCEQPVREQPGPQMHSWVP